MYVWNSYGVDNSLIFAANCGPPSPPMNGYINPYTSTREGSQVDVTCFSESQQKENYIVLLICSHDGSWQPNPTDICNHNSGTIQPYVLKLILVTSFSVAVVVEKQRRFFVNNLMFSVQHADISTRCSSHP